MNLVIVDLLRFKSHLMVNGFFKHDNGWVLDIK